jgi:hypothetical protein
MNWNSLKMISAIKKFVTMSDKKAETIKELNSLFFFGRCTNNMHRLKYSLWRNKRDRAVQVADCKRTFWSLHVSVRIQWVTAQSLHCKITEAKRHNNIIYQTFVYHIINKTFSRSTETRQRRGHHVVWNNSLRATPTVCQTNLASI